MWFQGFVCSPINVIRELGLERRETVRSLSTVDKIVLEYLIFVREDQVSCTDCLSVVFFKSIAELATYKYITAESI
jgi:hypothetical protein